MVYEYDKGLAAVQRKIVLGALLLFGFAVSSTASETAWREYLLEKITSGKPKEVAHAAHDVADLEHVDEDTVKALSAALQNKDISVRLACCKSLGRLGPRARAAEQQLENLQESQSGLVRTSAAVALVAVADSAEAKKYLQGQLDSDTPLDRQTAMALLKHSRHAAKPFVRKIATLCVSEDFKTKASALKCLTALGPIAAQARNELLAGLSDESPIIRERTCLFFAGIGRLNENETGALETRLSDLSCGVRANAAYALLTNDGKHTEARKALNVDLEHTDPLRNLVAANVLRKLDQQSLPAKRIFLRSVTDQSVRVRLTSCMLLCENTDDGFSTDYLISFLADSDASIRADAATALGEMSATKALPKLRKMLGDQDATTRASVREAIDAINRTMLKRKLLGPQTPDGPAGKR